MQLEMIMIVPGVIFLSQCIFYTTFGVFNRFIRIHIFPIGQTGVLPLSLCLIAGQFLALLIAWQIASQPVSQTQREREREIAMQGAKEMERNGDRGQLSVSSVVETSVAVAVWRRGIPDCRCCGVSHWQVMHRWFPRSSPDLSLHSTSAMKCNKLTISRLGQSRGLCCGSSVIFATFNFIFRQFVFWQYFMHYSDANWIKSCSVNSTE